MTQIDNVTLVDQNGFEQRIKNLLPTTWFPNSSQNDLSSTPILDNFVSSLSTQFVFSWQQIYYVAQQARISTATDILLDTVAIDFLGPTFTRRSNENDVSFRSRIKANLLNKKLTRTAIIDGIKQYVGSEPSIVEPQRPVDLACAGYGGYGSSYIGSYNLNNQFFIQIERIQAQSGLTGGIAGIGTSEAGASFSPYFAFANEQTIAGDTGDNDIYNTLSNLLSCAGVAWVALTDQAPTAGSIIDINFYLDESNLGDLNYFILDESPLDSNETIS